MSRKIVLLIGFLSCGIVVAAEKPQRLQISGIYPNLCTYTLKEDVPLQTGNECGIGAVVPWAGKLYMINYGAHYSKGSSHSLYVVDEDLNMSIHPDSVGGTPAGRMIHKESNQLLMGPYLIDTKGNVRVIPPDKMSGRLSAIARHLKDPANWVYYYDMEGMLYEANVHTLEVKKLFHDIVPGCHGKGAYTSQGRLVIANNGEGKHESPDEWQVKVTERGDSEDAGTLAQWDGQKWEIVERRQYTDVTGPGGIYGASDENSPLWSIGWDKRSLRLKLLDGGKWYTFLLPKAAHDNDPAHGFFTEWPRIREIGSGRMMMDMHGMFYNFPETFSLANMAGISPIGSHLRYIPDFCEWNGQLVIASDETSIQGNKLSGQPQCNLWFGKYEELKEWGPASGWGGPWINDEVKANVPSEPFLVNGFDRRILHLAVSKGGPVTVTLETDRKGKGKWDEFKKLDVKEYVYYIFPADFNAQWIRLKCDKDCRISAYFHMTDGHYRDAAKYSKLFAGLANADDKKPFCSALIYAAKRNRNLFVIAGDQDYYDFTKDTFEFKKVEPDEKLKKLLLSEPEFTVDEASVIIDQGRKGKYRLPKGSSAYDKPFSGVWPRSVREVESERELGNFHGTFYELPLTDAEKPADYSKIRPVSSHGKRIMDFATWNGLLVLSGVNLDAKEDGHVYKSNDGDAGLWFGGIDDLWKLGKPVGTGGPWKNTRVTAGEPSDPYLMTGYDRKTVEISADKDVKMTLEVDFDHQSGWHVYKVFDVEAGKKLTYEFEEGFSAHWIRAVADRNCEATVWFIYE